MKKSKNIVANDDVKLGSFIKIIIGILVVLVCFTLMTMFLTRDKSKKANDSNEIQYTEIMAGSILNRPENQYYVLIAKKDSFSTFEESLNKYKEKESHLRVYKVDLDDAFNSDYVSEYTMIGDDMTNTKFAETTLLYIENGSISDYKIGNDADTYLYNLSA